MQIDPDMLLGDEEQLEDVYDIIAAELHKNEETSRGKRLINNLKMTVEDPEIMNVPEVCNILVWQITNLEVSHAK